jgi:hypothetical protein
MSGWGNYDALTLYGTSVSVTNGSNTVIGTGTQFTANLQIGDVVGIHSDLFTKNRVAAVTNNTILVLADPFIGTSNASLPMSFVKENQQPKYVYHDGDAMSGFDTIQNVYGVDVAEIDAGLANVTSVMVQSAGTKYVEAPAVTFSSGSAAATAYVSGGAVANVTLTATGNSYSSTPTVTIGAPFITFNGSSASVVVAAANTIAYTGHLFATGDAAVYSKGAGGTVITGLTDASTYYIIKIGANAVALASSLANATSNTQVDITAVGVGTAHTLTLTSGAATAIASLGVGNTTTGKSKVPHAGWVKKTVGTGGRAGRIQYETLVALGTITTDAVDDLTFPDA